MSKNFRINHQRFCENMIVHTLNPNTNVLAEAQEFSEVVCILLIPVFLKVLEVFSYSKKNGKQITLIRAACGWLLVNDGTDQLFVDICTNPEEAEAAWKLEEEKKQRVASAVVSTLINSCSLPRAKRLGRSILKHATQFYPSEKSVTKISKESMEDIMLILSGQTGFSKQQIFEYIKAAAARQSNPRQAIVDIAQNMFEMLCKRPSEWVTEDLHVIYTLENQIIINQFIMTAAHGDLEDFKNYLYGKKMELTALHSELHYTAFHAAADFGQINIIKFLMSLGIGLDIREPKLGQTALHYAAYGGRAEVIRLLLDAGANRNIKDNNGVYPYEAADRQGNYECRELLKFLPPTVPSISIEDITIDSFSALWKPPVLNSICHSALEVYEIQVQNIDADQSIPDPQTQVVKTNHCHYADLHSACAYRLRIRVKCVSGWSDYSQWVPVNTLAFSPEAPAPVEIIKVTTNSIVISWFPPWRTNGFPVELYEVEIFDHKMVQQRIKSGLNKNDDKPNEDILKQLEASSSFSKQDKLLQNRKEKRQKNQQKDGNDLSSVTSSVSLIRRLIKHQDLRNLTRFITGIEPYRFYQIRLRAFNKLGFGKWSEWCAPVCPQIGVTIKEFHPEKFSALLTWFEPILNTSQNREVDAYELQLCRIKGPMSVGVQSQMPEKIRIVEKKSSDEDNISVARPPKKYEEEEFVTITDTLKSNQYELTGLKAGTRYIIRVRFKVTEGDWVDYDLAMRSDSFVMPATVPDPPLNIRPQLIDNPFASIYKKADDHFSSVNSIESSDMSLLGQESLNLGTEENQLSLENNSFIPPPSKITIVDDYEIMHDSITVTWDAGDSNGANVLEYEIEMSRIRTYRPQDVLHAKEAFLGLENTENSSVGMGTLELPYEKHASDESADADSLVWENITVVGGQFQGLLEFKATGLSPGCAYIFRVRERNMIAWSKWSKASPIIVTYPSVPPGKPVALQVKSTYAVICWKEVVVGDGSVSMTTLDQEVQLRTLRSSVQAKGSVEKAVPGEEYDSDWFDAPAVRMLSLPELGHYYSTTKSDLSGACSSPNELTAVMLTQLVEFRGYVARVRVRTVVGWSPWGSISEEFRTTAL